MYIKFYKSCSVYKKQNSNLIYIVYKNIACRSIQTGLDIFFITK